jgi:hypothetical protein
MLIVYKWCTIPIYVHGLNGGEVPKLRSFHCHDVHTKLRKNQSLSAYNNDVAESDTDTCNSQAGFQRRNHIHASPYNVKGTLLQTALLMREILMNGSVLILKFTGRVGELNIKLQIQLVCSSVYHLNLKGTVQ